MSVIKTLNEETKANYLRNSKEYKSYAFEVDGYKIFPLFESPHLLKGLRNNLLKKDAKYSMEDGTEKNAKWEHLRMLLDIDVGDQEVRLVNKLTEFHVLEHKIPKMKVKYAAQIFSQRVSGALRFVANRGILPEECRETARFLTIFDNLFDSFNGHTYSDTEKKFMGCLKNKSPHLVYWKEILQVIKSLVFKIIVKNIDGTKKIKYEKVPSISNWAMNIETFTELWEMLNKEHNLSTLLTRNFNQDPLENFLSGIRSNGVRNINPTCVQFINAYKTLMVNMLNSPHSVNANCESDNNKCFNSLKSLMQTSADFVPQKEYNVNFNIDKLVETLWNPNCCEGQDNVIHRESKRYVAGYIMKKCQNKIFKNMGWGAKAVLRLCKIIKNKACVVYFDNFFTSLELIHHLRESHGIFSLGTIRTNRLRNAAAKLKSDKLLKSQGRGAYSQIVCSKTKLSLVKWNDNKLVVLASSFTDAHPVTKVKGYCKIKKQKVEALYPDLVKQYNAHMGGVDLADMLIALYRTEMKTRRWCLSIFSQMLDICVNNAWLMYRRDNTRKGLKKHMLLKLFKLDIFKALIKKGRNIDANCVKDLKKNDKIKKPTRSCPVDDVRYDTIDYFPEHGTEYGRCTYCKKGFTTVYCLKCNVRLCFVKGRTCHFNYHHRSD